MSEIDLKERVLRLEKLVNILLEHHPRCAIKAGELLDPRGKTFQRFFMDEYQGEFLPKGDDDEKAE